MKKNKLSIIFAILTCISIFSVAAIADQCGCRFIPVGENVNVKEISESAEEEVSQEEGKDSIEEEQEEAIVEETEQETGEDGNEEEATEEEQPQQQVQEEAPTITLEIYEGPLYSQADNICYWRIKAIVSGTPTPTVEFSKDDSNGAWGSRKVQVNIEDPPDSYTLIATATNSEGSATDSINLSWGCPIPNNPPVISDITFMGNHYVGQVYTFSAAASDPDGDSLSYHWSVSGGSLANTNTNPVKWTMPNTPGSYDITVTVDDGNGGEDIKTETVEVLALATTSITDQGGGIVYEGNGAMPGPGAVVGDDPQNRAVRGFLGFDISSLAGKEVVSAEMIFSHFLMKNDAFSIIDKLRIEAVYWGTDLIEPGDYDIPGTSLGEYDIPTFVCSTTELIDALNQAIDNGHDRFQIRISHKGQLTDHDGIQDSIDYGGNSPVKLIVTYIP